MTSFRKLLVVICLATLAVVSWVPAVNSESEHIAQQGLKRTLTTFALVRTISSTVAVLSSANVGVIKVGEALHPISKLIDQFLDVMLIASASFALQLILLKVGAHWLVSLLLSISLTYAGYRLFTKRQGSASIANSIVVLLILARFAVPVTVIGTQALYKFAIEDREVVALSKVGTLGSSSEVGGNDSATEEMSTFDKLKDIIPLKGKVTKFLDAAKNATGHFVALIAGYVLQAVFLPLVFLYIFLLAAGAALRNIFSIPSRITLNPTV